MHKTKREESWRRFIPLKSFEYLASDRKKLPPARRSNRSGGKTRSKLFERGKWKGRKAPSPPPPPPFAFRFASFQGLISRWFIFLQGVPMALPQKVAQSERWLHPFSSFLCFSVITTIPSACRRLRSRSTAFTDHVEIRNDSTMMVEEPIGMIGEMKGW